MKRLQLLQLVLVVVLTATTGLLAAQWFADHNGSSVEAAPQAAVEAAPLHVEATTYIFLKRLDTNWEEQLQEYLKTMGIALTPENYQMRETASTIEVTLGKNTLILTTSDETAIASTIQKWFEAR